MLGSPAWLQQPMKASVYYKGSGRLAMFAQNLRPARPSLSALTLADKPIRLDDSEQVKRYLQGSNLLHFLEAPNHRYKRDDPIAPTLLTEEDWKNRNYPELQFDYSMYNPARAAVADTISTAAIAAQDWLEEQYRNNHKFDPNYHIPYPRAFKRTNIQHPVRCSVYEKVKIPPGPITLEYDLENSNIPIFEGQLDYGFALVQKSAKGILTENITETSQGSSGISAGIMLCDSEEELIKKDWQWRAISSVLYLQMGAKPLLGKRFFTLAVTDGYAWRFYTAGNPFYPFVHIDVVNIYMTLNLLHGAEDWWRVVEILADMMLFEYSPYFDYHALGRSDDDHESRFLKEEDGNDNDE